MSRLSVSCLPLLRMGLAIALGSSLPLVAACDAEVETIELSFDAATVQTTLVLGPRSLVDVRYASPGGLVELEVDCSPGEDTDVRGPSFSVSGAFTATVPRAGYERIRAVVPAGEARFQIIGSDGPQTCALRLTPTPTACGPSEEFRSVNVDHNHVSAGDEPRSDWEPFPVSGNHYSVWAGWDRAYDLPIRTGYLLHGLEHGGIVLSYACVNTLESAACTQATTDLTDARTRFAQRRTLVTPDPRQPLLYAARAWRWGYTSACYEPAALDDFMARRFRKGREDIDSDTAGFDPTK